MNNAAKKDTQFQEPEVHDCPRCGGPGLLEEERGTGFYVMCMDCGSHTVTVPYKTSGETADRGPQGSIDSPEKLIAAKGACELWNFGKVIAEGVGE